MKDLPLANLVGEILSERCYERSTRYDGQVCLSDNVRVCDLSDRYVFSCPALDKDRKVGYLTDDGIEESVRILSRCYRGD